MIIKDSMFGFEIKVKTFSFDMKRPKPPAGFIPYNSNKANCQSGKCPNCGHKKPGTVGRSNNSDGFQDRAVQNVFKVLKRLVRRLTEDQWKPFHELFSIDLDSTKERYSTMLKCHPSRFGTAKFCCCDADIWHDFGGNIGEWNYYYRPSIKDKNTLTAWI